MIGFASPQPRLSKAWNLNDTITGVTSRDSECYPMDALQLVDSGAICTPPRGDRLDCDAPMDKNVTHGLDICRSLYSDELEPSHVKYYGKTWAADET